MLIVVMKEIPVSVLVYTIFFSCFLIIMYLPNMSAESNYLEVPEDYITIQSAIDDSNESDIIIVSSGTYNENLMINKNISILGENKDNTIISGSNQQTIKIKTATINISGFTIKNTGESFPCIFLEDSKYSNIHGNLIKMGGYGLVLKNSDSNTINDNIIQENNVGIKLTFSKNNVINNNIIMNNGANGILISFSSDDNILYLNNFLDNIQSNARDSCLNYWNYNSQGNFWDDYNNYDNDSDGVGDQPYEIDGGGNTDNYPLGYFKNQKPEAFIVSINPESSIYGEDINFNGYGTDDGIIIEWEWKSSEDGIISSSEDFTASSLKIGTHTIFFRVKDDDNDWSEYVTSTITILKENKKPTANIITLNPSEATEEETIYFHGIGSDPDGLIVEYHWRSSIDGFLSNNSSFTKSDLSVGNHSIYFKTRDNKQEWSSEDSQTLKITSSSTLFNEPPKPDTGGPYFAYLNDPIVFNASKSYDTDGEIVKFTWIFGDDSMAIGELVNHSYTNTGNFSVNLTIIDNDGKESSNSTYAYIIKNSSDLQNEKETKSINTPGFEILIFIIAIIFIIFRKRRFKI